MRVFSDIDYQNMTYEDLMKEFHRIEEKPPDENIQENLLKRLKILQRKRHTVMWHDGATISNHSHLLFVTKCLYDPAVYPTDEEYKVKTSMSYFIVNLNLSSKSCL